MTARIGVRIQSSQTSCTACNRVLWLTCGNQTAQQPVQAETTDTCARYGDDLDLFLVLQRVPVKGEAVLDAVHHQHRSGACQLHNARGTGINGDSCLRRPGQAVLC